MRLCASAALSMAEDALYGDEVNYLLDVLAADSPPQRGTYEPTVTFCDVTRAVTQLFVSLL